MAGVDFDQSQAGPSPAQDVAVQPKGVSASALHQHRQDFHVARPLISVIVPVYNAAKILERCVNSILSQTYPNLEIILIDDGSTDMSGKFCDIFAKKDSHIKVIHQKNQGQSAARNAGLDFAHGEYITFVDCDDEIEPTLITELYQLIVEHNVKLAIGSFLEVLPSGERKPFATGLAQNAQTPLNSESPKATQKSPSTTLLSTEECLIDMLLEQNFAMAVWGKLYARELFNHVSFPAGEIYEDVATTYRLILQCSNIALTTSTKYLYYHNKNSTTRQSFHRQKLSLIRFTDQMCDEIWQQLGQNQAASSIQSANDPDSNSALQFSLRDVLNKRRMQARFGVLRQMVMLKTSTISPETTGMTKREFRRTRRTIVKYLRRHKNYILKNSCSTRRDLLAMRALLVGLPAFKFAWQVYQKRNQ